MKIALIKKIVFLLMSILFLIIGLIGLNRATLRSGVEFRWEEKEDNVIVTAVFPGSIAQKKGLASGDRLLKIDGQTFQQGQEIEFLLDSRKPGQQISLTIQRDGKEHTFFLILVPRYDKKFIIINLFLGTLFWIIGVFVYLKKSNEKAARVFAWGCITIAMAVVMIWPGYPIYAHVIEYLLSALYFAFYTIAPALIFYLTVLYPKEKLVLQRHRFLHLILFIPGLIFIVLLTTSYVSATYLTSPKYYRNYYQIYNAFRIYFILYLMLSIGSLIHSYKSSDNQEDRKKIKWILWGLCVGTIPFLFFWSLPQVLGFSPLLPEEINYFFLMIIPLAIALSIVKYQALDIEIIINRGLVYVIVTGVIIACYLLLVGLVGHIVQTMTQKTSHILVIIFTLVAAALFSPIRQRIQTFVDKTFYRVKYSYRLAMKDFSQALTLAHDQVELVDLIIQNITVAIPVEKIAVLARNPSAKLLEVCRNSGLTEDEKNALRFEFTSELLQIIDHNRVPMVKKSRTEISDAVELPNIDVLDWINFELLIPIILQNEIKGLLLVGKKSSGIRFSEEDLHLLVAMAEEGFIAIEQLKLREAIILERTEREKLEELNRLKSDFVSHVSHELRTPLTSITWSVENLLDGIPEKPSPKIGEYLMGIHNSSQHLSRMIENLLNITKIEAERIEIYPEKLNIHKEIHELVKTIKPLTEKKEILLQITSMEELWVKADKDYLQAILSNLLDNAVKYSEEKGTVQIQSKIAAKEESQKAGTKVDGMVAISVIDHGVGIPREKQKLIFGQFERIKNDKSTREKGLGLGLYIVKKLVELQKGTIWVESEAGKGSTFTFVLPRAL